MSRIFLSRFEVSSINPSSDGVGEVIKILAGSNFQQFSFAGGVLLWELGGGLSK